uniref:Spiroplasma plectrovirus-related protein n=1 Tax=Heterorhabditis bacteriophora TaxID=37862 RepID=A0A1I7XT35_HETBA
MILDQIRRKLASNVCDDVMEVGWSFLWNITVVCKILVYIGFVGILLKWGFTGELNQRKSRKRERTILK